jgi:reactive intermediate/imine deaminase
MLMKRMARTLWWGLAGSVSVVVACASAAEPPAVQFVNTGKVIAPSSLPFSEAVRVDNMLYLSGQVGAAPGTSTLVPGGIKSEARQALANIKTILETQGLNTRDVVRCTVMLADIADWAAFNEVYLEFFAPPYPARSAFATSGLSLGARVEVECVAVFGH